MLISLPCCVADSVGEDSGLGDDIHVGAAGEAELGGANGLLELETSFSSISLGKPLKLYTRP